MSAGFKHKYYNKGAANQKRADVIIDFSRPDSSKIKQWSEQDRVEVEKFLDFATATFEAFKKAILDSLRTKTID